MSSKNRLRVRFKQFAYQLIIVAVLAALSLAVWFSLQDAPQTPSGPVAGEAAGPALPPAGEEQPPAPEPAAGRLFFVGPSSEETGALYSVAPDGTNLTQIATVAFNGQPPAVTPAGERLAYVSACQREAVMTANADGSQPIAALEQPMIANISDLTWSPAAEPETGRRLAFTALRSDDPTLYLLGVDPALTTLYPTPSDLAAYAEPAWSPDGRRVVYTGAEEAGRSSLYVVTVDSRETTRLTEAPPAVSGPQWSPDGERIVFVAENSGPGSDLYTIRADGGELTRLTNDPAIKREPAWSPDGTWLAYSGETAGSDFDIYVLTAAGTERTRLATVGADLAPTWSPDGRWIAFVSEAAGGDKGLYVAPAAGAEPARVTGQSLQASRLAWTPPPVQEPDQVTIRGVAAEVEMTELPTRIVLEQPVEGYSRILFKEEAVSGLDRQTGQTESGRTTQTRVVTRNGFGTGGMIRPGTPIEVIGQPGENGTLSADVIWLMDFEAPCRGISSTRPVAK